MKVALKQRTGMRALCAVLLLSGASLEAQVPPNKTFEIADIFSLKAAGSAEISPDGRTIAYVRRTGDIMTDRFRPSIWLVDVATGQERELAAGDLSAFDPKWAPDGQRLSFFSSRGGSTQLYVADLKTGERLQLTNGPDAPKTYAWSRDGKQIAFLRRVPSPAPDFGTLPAKPAGAQWATPLRTIDRVTYRFDGQGYAEPGYDHIFVVPSTGGTARQVTTGDVNDAPTVAWDPAGALSWTADSRGVLFSAIRTPDWQRRVLDTEVYAADVATGTVTALTDRRGPDRDAQASPDGRLIAYLGYDDDGSSHRDTRLYVMNRDGSGARRVGEKVDFGIEQAQWTPDGEALIVAYDKAGVRRLGRITLEGQLTELAAGLAGAGLDQPYTAGSFSVGKGAIAFASGSVERPADVSVLQNGKVRQLTHLNDALLSDKGLGQARRFPVRAADGTTIDGWLVTPPGYRPGTRVPLILNIHGGPDMSFGPLFSSDVQLFAAAGYAVLMPNYRGSTSYGEAFSRMIDHDFPGETFGDLMASVDAAIDAGVADPNNLFVTGGSAGGILTAWVVGKTHRFKGAVAQKMIANRASGALVMDATLYTSLYDFGGPPWKDPMAYWKRSPLSLVGDITTPTMMIVGSEDYRTPVSESEQFYGALQIAGVPTALVEVPGVGHVNISSRPSQSAARAAAILSWFDRYRSPGEASLPSAKP